MKIIALICARGNSRGVKNKNLLKFKNTTLLGNAIKQASRSRYVKRVFVSTDSEKLAKDKSPEIETWRHAVKFLNKKNNINFIASIPTTSPLRKVSDIDNCIKHAIKKNLDVVFSVTESAKNPYFNIVKLKNKKLSLVCSSKKNISRRQDAPQCYDLTTVCYVFKPEYIMKNKNLFSGKTGFVVIPKHRATDIDDKTDYKIAKFLSH